MCTRHIHICTHFDKYFDTQALEMKNTKGLAKKHATSDRAARLLSMLTGSADAEEALLKRCAHFDLEGTAASALDKCSVVVQRRTEELAECKSQVGACNAPCVCPKHTACLVRQLRREIGLAYETEGCLLSWAKRHPDLGDANMWDKQAT